MSTTNEKISDALDSIASQVERRLYNLQIENKLLKDEIKILLEEHEYLCRLIERRKKFK